MFLETFWAVYTVTWHPNTLKIPENQRDILWHLCVWEVGRAPAGKANSRKWVSRVTLSLVMSFSTCKQYELVTMMVFPWTLCVAKPSPQFRKLRSQSQAQVSRSQLNCNAVHRGCGPIHQRRYCFYDWNLSISSDFLCGVLQELRVPLNIFTLFWGTCRHSWHS